MKTKFKKDQHVVCKFDGKNGDLIVGRIKSVRSNGEIVLINLLTNATSTKKASVLMERNTIVSKAAAMAVLASSKDKVVLRQRAIAAGKKEATKQLKLDLAPAPIAVPDAADAVITAYRALTSEERKKALRGILNTVMMEL